MIYLGLSEQEKKDIITKYCADNSIRKVFAFSPLKFKTEFPGTIEYIDWPDIIMYKFFYRLLQEIDHSTLIIINECLRTQNRNDLTYNCLRNYLNQTNHHIIFQYLPFIENFDDFMTLFDFDTRSRWKREKWNPDIKKELKRTVNPIKINLCPINVLTDIKIKEQYTKTKKKLFDGLGQKDPHTIPRNLYLISGKAKLETVDKNLKYIGRNNRFNLSNMQTYKESSFVGSYTVFEFSHNFLDFIDFLSLSRQGPDIPVLVSDLKVDQWYFKRYQTWVDKINDAYKAII